MSPKKPAKPSIEVIDYRSDKPMPAWVRDVIDTHLAIEQEGAKSAGALGFMARALVIATMPYRDQKNEDGTPKDSFTRTNGDFRLRIVAGSEKGIPYGIYPRLLMSWVTTEAVRRQSPVIELGDTLREFLREVLELRSSGGGVRGSATRVSEQMERLFGSLITAQYTGGLNNRGFTLRNVLIADEAAMDGDEMARFDAELSGDAAPASEGRQLDGVARARAEAGEDGSLWLPQERHEAGQWRSHVRLSNRFFQECVNNPVPIDLRAYKSLRGSALAMDVYTWLTYRMKYTHRRTKPIPWEGLMGQFGSNYNTADLGQAVRDFKKAFLAALKPVSIVYPAARFEVQENGLVLIPSPPHVLPAAKQVPAKQTTLF
jgi:hypothetical protein